MSQIKRKELTMKNVLSEALQEFVGLLGQLLKNLLGDDAEVWGNELKKFLRKESCWVETLESFFKRTVSLVLEPTQQTFNVAHDLSKILLTKKKGGKIDWLDLDIVNWFGNITIEGRKEKITTYVYRFLKDLTHQKIISTGKRFSVYRKYNLFDAISLAQKLIDVGEIKTPGTGVIIYLEEEYNSNPCRLSVFRSSDGKLHVGVYRVDLDGGWNADDGVCFS